MSPRSQVARNSLTSLPGSSDAMSTDCPLWRCCASGERQLCGHDDNLDHAVMVGFPRLPNNAVVLGGIGAVSTPHATTEARRREQLLGETNGHSSKRRRN